LLRGGEDALVFIEAGGFDFGEAGLEMGLVCTVHRVLFRI
jgi:hypothetical protein